MTRAIEHDDVMERVLDHARREFPNFQFDRVDDQWRAVNGAAVFHAGSVAALCAKLRDEHAPLLLTDDQAYALALHLGRAFPPWRVWRAADTWYATGPCRLPECVCSRTLHAPDPVGLCQQLDKMEQAGRKQRGDGALSNEAAFLLGEGQFSDEAAELAERQLQALQQAYPGWDITCVADLSAPAWHAKLRAPLTEKQKAAGVCESFMCFSAEALAAVLATQVERMHRGRASNTFTS